jgi:RNA polymerase sigma factor (TIGR02999 family)
MVKKKAIGSPSSPPARLTQLLVAWSKGDRSALDALTPLVHEELRRLAHHYMNRERAGHSLQTTALVNEAYLRLIDQQHVEFDNRSQFLALAATLMRHILVDHARNRRYLKHGGGAVRVSFDKALIVSAGRDDNLVELDEALVRLAAIDVRKSKVVELRFFGGLSVEETADALDVSAVTVMREWRMAKAWLYNSLSNEA